MFGRLRRALGGGKSATQPQPPPLDLSSLSVLDDVALELPEVLGMADRILVMHDGRITGELDNRAGVTQEQVMQLAMA